MNIFTIIVHNINEVDKMYIRNRYNKNGEIVAPSDIEFKSQEFSEFLSMIYYSKKNFDQKNTSE